jgi:hypothetical protein
MLLRKFLALTVMFALLFPSGAAADDCNPTAGDQMHDWVDTHAAQISRQLASADFDTRLFNYFLVSLDDMHQRIQDESAALVTIEARIGASEVLYSKQDVIHAAISRDADAQGLLNDLFRVRSELDVTRGRYTRLITLPSNEEFQLDGFGNVGRATLLTSFMDLGSTAAQSLQAKFSFSMSVTVNDDGDITQATVMPQAGMVDTIALALAAEAGPYGYCAFAAFELVKFGIAQAGCADKIQHQKDRMSDAFRLLPSKLITNKDQYLIYSQSYSRWLGQFQQHISHVDQALTSLDDQWRNLLAYNVARERASQTVLTAAKLTSLGQQYGVDNAVTSLFDNAGIAELSDNVADMNSFLARSENALLQSCRSPTGLRAAEDYADGLQYAGAAYGLLQKQASLVPLSHLMEQSLKQISTATTDADALTKALPECSISPLRLRLSRKARQPLMAYAHRLTLPSVPQHSKASRLVLRSSRFALLDLASPADGPGWSFCTLVITGGGTYDCQAANGGGTTYDSGFTGADQDPYTGILLAAQDGGYATDNRQVSADIAAATANLNQRISDLGKRSANARAALPKWLADNEQAVATAIQSSAASTTSIANDQAAFLTQNSALMVGAEASIDTFIQSPYDRTAATVLLANVAGADLSLPNIPPSEIPPDMPPIVGVSAISRAYGDATGLERNLRREALKVNEEFANDSDLKSQALEDIEAARRFSSTQTPEGQKIASALLDDAAALRYFRAGKLSKISYSTITPDGVLGRSETGPGQPIPKDAITQVISHFEGDSAVYNLKLNAAKSVVQSGITDFQQRQDVLQTSSKLGSMAGSLFYDGEPSKASTILKYATVLIDVATAWAPGISWGRSIYEVVTGKSLISGISLDNLSYGVAVVAMVSGGVGEEAMSASSVESTIKEVVDTSRLQASENAVNLFDKILAAEEHIAPQLLDFSQHAIQDGMVPLQLSESQVEKLIEVGKPYFDGSALTVDNAGLVYVTPLSKIATLSANEPEVMIVAAVSVDSNKIISVYKIDVPSLAQVEAKTVSDISGEKRFVPLPPHE